MERTRHFCLVFLLLAQVVLFAQKKNVIYEAYVSGDMMTWKKEIHRLESRHPTRSVDLVQLIDAHYGYIGWCIDQERYSEAKDHLRKARKLTDRLEKRNYKPDLMAAYRSAYVGFDIGFAPYKAPFIGPKSLDFAETAKARNPNCAMAFIQLGNIAFYTPKVFGGSIDEALEHYQKAKALMEKSGECDSNWNYLSLKLNIIQANMALEHIATAKVMCEELLKQEPRLKWVEQEIYSSLIESKE